MTSQTLNAVLGASLLVVLAWAIASRVSRKRYMRDVERLAFHDALTDLPNRLLFLDRASVAFAHARRNATAVAVVFLDLDRFKLINDSFGHDMGDEVLRVVARRLREQVREVDTVARMGGDEFTLLMPGIRHSGDIETISSKLCEAFRKPIELEGRELVVTASIGISVFPSDAADAEILLRYADQAMYYVKQRGGDDVQVFAPGMDDDAREALELESRLRRALAQEEFVLYYQPRLDVATGRAVAFEALLRWDDPERGIITPKDFIHAAEVSGLIVPIGEWVLRAACRQACDWHSQGREDMVVSVNLSARQFHRPDLARTIAKTLEETGLAPQFLELEIDENCVMNRAEDSLPILVALKETGVRVLISHFGAGYWSLTHLRRFPIDGLKLDRSFMDVDQDDRPLARAALMMAKALRLKVVGEGVETEEAAQFLRAQSCDDMQGYLVSVPAPASELGQWIM